VAYVIFAALTFKNVSEIPHADWAAIFEKLSIANILRQFIDKFNFKSTGFVFYDLNVGFHLFNLRVLLLKILIAWATLLF